MLSLCHIALKATETVSEQLMVARTLACSIGSTSLEADVEYTGAVHEYTSGRFDEASKALHHLLSLKSLHLPWQKVKSRTLALEEIRARAYDLLGHIAANSDDFTKQANYIYLALAELDKIDTRDPYIEAQILSNLVLIAADRDVDGVFQFVRNRLLGVKFPGECQVFEFEIRRNLGLCASMHGDHVGALREFRRSSEIAPNRASKIKALVDRSSLANELNECTFANEELDYAFELTKQVDWSKVSSTESFALLAMSQNLAKREPVEARRLLNLFSECKKRHNPFQTAPTDFGFAGREFQADALVTQFEGNRERAVQLNIHALHCFKRVGYVGRAATVAVELFELTGERSYLEYAATYTKKLPHSHLARRVNGYLSGSQLTA